MTYHIRPTPDGYALLYGDRIVISPLGLLDACAVWWGVMGDEIERVSRPVTQVPKGASVACASQVNSRGRAGSELGDAATCY